MCGIAGFSCKHPVTFASVQNTVKALGHRGPDDSGICYERSSDVGLIHTRLAIQDLSPLGCQPMYSQDRQIVLVFNGEIYNVESIRASLVANGVSFSGRSDTEILLNLYLTEGEGMLSRLNGIFAFALWDRRKQKLLLARDAFGIKPLYYSMIKDELYFSSSAKSIYNLTFFKKTQWVFFCGRYIIEFLHVISSVNSRNGGIYARALLIYTWKKNQQ